MAEKIAKVHKHVSNRAKAREVGERKAVYKSVLDNPFRISWPSIPLNLQNSVLAVLINLLEGVANFQHHHRQSSRKRKRSHCAEVTPRKKRKVSGEGQLASSAEMDLDRCEVDATNTSAVEHPDRPPVLDHIAVGINQVTKLLENQVRAARKKVVTAATRSAPESTTHPLKFIFVCRADVNPSLIIDHFPHLAAAFNSSRAQETLKLISLPKGAETTLAKVLGLQKAAVIGLKSTCPGTEAIMTMLENVPTLKAIWLAPPLTSGIIPTHVKQVKTSAPKDMKAAKERRKQGRAAAKQRRLDPKEGKAVNIMISEPTRQ